MEEMADSSGVGVPPRNSAEQEQASDSVTLKEKEPRAVEWTDEKHMLFLKSMESTFVSQLYKSLDLSGWHSRNNCVSKSKSPKHKRTSACAPSGQFKVHHDGRWSKIDFTRDEPEDNQEKKPIAPLRSQWIQHYRRSERRVSRKSPDSQAKARDFQMWGKDSMGGGTEGTDQNFNDEDREEVKPGRTHEIKRNKTSNDAVMMSNDQVVPFDNISQADDVADSCMPAED